MASTAMLDDQLLDEVEGAFAVVDDAIGDLPPRFFESEWTDLESLVGAAHEGHQLLAGLMDEVFDDFELLSSAEATRSVRLREAEDRIDHQAREVDRLLANEARVQAELTSLQSRAAAEPERQEALKDQLSALQLERVATEAELEALRIRSADLADSLDDMRREASEERTHWSGELKQLRRLLEHQGELLSERHHGVHVETRKADVGVKSSTDATITTPTQAHKDAVLGSVMAQFELMQRDRQRRRPKS